MQHFRMLHGSAFFLIFQRVRQHHDRLWIGAVLDDAAVHKLKGTHQRYRQLFKESKAHMLIAALLKDL